MATAFDRMKREKGKNNDLKRKSNICLLIRLISMTIFYRVYHHKLKPQTLLKTSLSDFSLTFCSSMRLCKKSAAYLFSSATKTVKPFFCHFSGFLHTCVFQRVIAHVLITGVQHKSRSTPLRSQKKKVRDRNRIRSIVRYVIFAYEIKIQDQTFRMKRLKPIDCSIMSVSHISKFSIFLCLFALSYYKVDSSLSLLIHFLTWNFNIFRFYLVRIDTLKC